MVDKISAVVTLIVVAVIVYTMFTVMAKFDDPAYMCQSALGEDWEPAANVTPPESGWACEAPNGTVETVVIKNVTNDATFGEARLLGVAA